jgi:hypothetical protein
VPAPAASRRRASAARGGGRRIGAAAGAAAAVGWNTAPAAVLSRYAERGVFRSFTAQPCTGSRAQFSMQWHKDRNFEIVVDGALKSVRVTSVLPNVASRSSMDRAYRRFLEEFQNGELPPHRSIERRKSILKCVNRLGSVSVALEVRDGDYAYATEKLLAVVQETYLLFLQLGGYADYMVANLGANPDWGK